ncbi:unnamed protein product [Brassicogethes aeneus]|uniref:AAA+ ATPase domain-containing protein n=1 Tax=Brassicogethes aeneus TaxID=1431903 RepID=A0A9P0FHD4_BRAAE|nr:unnamed protein product [Brassicogethes aeneus]
MQDDLAVHVKDCCKNYGSKEVLRKLCMKVNRGIIYGLLGASGCGKTTLLSSIVGRKSIDSGEIWVLGGTPGAKGSGVPGPLVGYMPQDIALVGEFTVKDAIFYFGRILEMEDELIEQRFYHLSKLLELPPEDRYIKNCSGGQQRRVSFACAMVHMPELLILDEPTVGVDPVLRDRIWNYLVEITQKENIAVIITTHYIEECRQAHKIGLMREGKLLAEESPARLLTLFQTDSLEEVFLVLSRRQEEGRLDELNLDSVADEQNNSVLPYTGSTSTVATFDISHGSTDAITTKKPAKIVKTLGTISKNRVKALLDKNWKQFYRNITGLCFIVGFPLIQCMCFLLAVGGDIKDINLAVVNDETMTIKCENFSKNGTAVPYDFSSCHFDNLSCRFLTYLENPMINMVKYDTIDDAIQGVQNGEATGVVYMAHNFTMALENRTNLGKDSEDDVLDFSEIKVWMDMSNRQIGQTMKYKLLTLYLDFQKDVLEDCKLNKKLADMPLHFFDGIYGKSTETFTVFMTPGTLVTLIFFMGAIITSQIIITDRCEGVWDRSIVAGVSSIEITLTHFALQACIVVLHTVELLVLTFNIFRMDYIGHMWVMGIILYTQGLCGMSYGFWISVISYNHSMANILTTGTFVPMIIICGMVWPLEGMSYYLRIVSRCLPFTIAIESVRNVMKKGWEITDFKVYDGILVGIFWTLLFGVLSVYLMKKKR